MIKFLLKGIIRDSNRSRLPIIIISIGVVITIVLSGLIRGMMGDVINENARFLTGHVKIMSKAYADNIDQLPNDLALMGVDKLAQELTEKFPDTEWVQRIRFGGMIDIPDSTGLTRGQGPSAALAVELYSKTSKEAERLQLQNSLVSGSIPSRVGEVLIGHVFADKFNLKVGDQITFIGSTMNGAMAFHNFTLSGIIRFGAAAMDNGFMLLDVADARLMLDMDDAAGEILGFFKSGAYDDEKAKQMAAVFNADYQANTDEYGPVMFRLKEQNNLAGYLDYADIMSGVFVLIFVFAMSVVLWNTGLIGGLRRYQEFGIRLALGENKGHIYRTLLYEALLVGTIGSTVGTVLGLIAIYFLQVYGIDLGAYLEKSSMLMPSVMRARFSPDLLYIGYIPGLFAMFLGNLLSGIGIYKRETATLFKELEV